MMRFMSSVRMPCEYLPPAMVRTNAFTGEVQRASEPINLEVIRPVDEMPRLAQEPSEYR
jgi:hypothetical protein